MSKGPLGVENPKLYGTYLTEDGRWMVTCSSDGCLSMLPDCYDSEDDAEAVMAVLNKRELDRYTAENSAAVTEKLRGY